MNWYDKSVKPPRSGQYYIMDVFKNGTAHFAVVNYSAKYDQWNNHDMLDRHEGEPYTITAWAFPPDKDMILANLKTEY